METVGLSKESWPGGRMTKLFGTVGCILISTLLLVLPASGDTAAARHYQKPRAAVYINVDSTIPLADPQTRAREFDKIPLEVYRTRQFATDAQIGAAKRSYTSKSDADVAASFRGPGHHPVGVGQSFAASATPMAFP
jgi:hypothetical protein